jgi:peptidoglycan/xylan/chitin deacetylase (PgdA/CDA1 family)
MFYPVGIPWWIRKIYRHCIWDMPGDGNKIYLSFDDGPHPMATGFVLDLLKEYQAKATFFCIGKNVAAHTGLYQRIIAEGHRIGNHSLTHVNGWKTNDRDYINDIRAAAALIDSDLFRPPYGRVRFSQLRKLRSELQMKPVMWSVLSGDFDTGISPEQCAGNVVRHMRPGSIVVFHDSQKALEKLKYALPLVLAEIRKRGWVTETL